MDLALSLSSSSSSSSSTTLSLSPTTIAAAAATSSPPPPPPTTTVTSVTTSQPLSLPPATSSPPSTTTPTSILPTSIITLQPLPPTLPPTAATTGPKDGWELERKHIFILSSSGKPIFSRYGDEQELVTTFGLLQAVISITTTTSSSNSNNNIDQIKMIRAGNRKIIYYLKKSIYFILITSTNESEIILIKHLKFLNKIILLVLTSKVYDIYKKNSSADIRDLLGIDTLKLISSSCCEILTPTSIVYNSINSIICNKELRDDIISHLSTSVNASNAV